MAMESIGFFATSCLDGINALGEIERDYIHAELEASPSLHMLISMFEIVYERGNGQLWYYDEKRQLR